MGGFKGWFAGYSQEALGGITTAAVLGGVSWLSAHLSLFGATTTASVAIAAAPASLAAGVAVHFWKRRRRMAAEPSVSGAAAEVAAGVHQPAPSSAVSAVDFHKGLRQATTELQRSRYMARYEGRSVRWDGTVKDVTPPTGADELYKMTLATDTTRPDLVLVRCHPSSIIDLEELNAGDTATVEGTLRFERIGDSATVCLIEARIESYRRRSASVRGSTLEPGAVTVAARSVVDGSSVIRLSVAPGQCEVVDLRITQPGLMRLRADWTPETCRVSVFVGYRHDNDTRSIRGGGFRVLAEGSGLQPINVLFEEDAHHVSAPKESPGGRRIYVYNDGRELADVRLALLRTPLASQSAQALAAVERSLVGRVHTYSRVEGGLHWVWSVPRLRELARVLPVKTVRVGDIPELDHELWFGGPRNVRASCREVALHAGRILNADLSDPIILSCSGRVMDGMHQVARAWLEKRQTILAVQFERDPEPDERIPSARIV